MEVEEDVAEFLSSPLVRWVATLQPDMGGDVTWPDLAKGTGLAATLGQLGQNLQVTRTVRNAIIIFSNFINLISSD